MPATPVKPTTTYGWDSTLTNATQPSATLRSVGYIDDEIPTAAEFNYQLNSTGQWVDYLKNASDLTIATDAVQDALLGTVISSITGNDYITGTITGAAANADYSLICACTDQGEVLFSTNYGRSWGRQLVGAGQYYYGITYRATGTLWTVVGAAGVIRTSTNPSGVWASSTSGVATNLLGCYDDDTTCVVVGASNVILTATNPASTWTARTSALTAGTQLNGVRKGGSTWLIVANGGLAQTATTPTSTWTSRSTGVSENLNGIGYGNSNFVIGGASNAAGAILLTTSDPTVSFTRVVYSNGAAITGNNHRSSYNSISGLYVMANSSGLVLFSKDLVNWFSKSVTGAPRCTIETGTRLTSILGENGDAWLTNDAASLREDAEASMLAIRRGSIVNAFGITVATDADVIALTGDSANSRFIGVRDTATSTAQGWYMFTNSALGGVLVFPCGSSFRLDPISNWAVQGTITTPYSLDYDGTTYAVCTAAAGALFTSVAPFTTWTSRTSGTANALVGVASGSGFWVAVGSTATNTIRYNTTDPTTAWTSSSSGLAGTTAYLSVAYGNGRFVALTSTGAVIYSRDPSVAWYTSGSTLTSATALGFAGDRFYAYGLTGQLFTSVDGITWTTLTNSDWGRIQGVVGIPMGRNRYCYIMAITPYNGQFIYSTDGVTWNNYTSTDVSGAVTIDLYWALNSSTQFFSYDKTSGRCITINNASDLLFSRPIPRYEPGK